MAFGIDTKYGVEAYKRVSFNFGGETIEIETKGSTREELLNSNSSFKSASNLHKVHEAMSVLEGKAQFDVARLLFLLCGFQTIMWIVFSIGHVPQMLSKYTRIHACRQFSK